MKSKIWHENSNQDTNNGDTNKVDTDRREQKQAAAHHKHEKQNYIN